MKRWKRYAVAAAVLLGVAAVGGGLVVVLGLAPISASSRHWAVTSAFLHFAMERSIATHAPEGDPPPLDDPSLIVKGAGHYHTACLPCHGGPDRAYFPKVAFGMTPPPPFLPSHVSDWEPQELFQIVKHGVKFTGMPAWPALERDDEVYAMVAFLRKLPELDSEEYRELAHGPVAGEAAAAARLHSWAAEPSERALIVACARCHGEDGGGRGVGAFPRLAGQHREYLVNALEAYARGERHSGIMQPVAVGLDGDAIRFLASHYSAMPGGDVRTAEAEDAAAVARGEEIARRGIPAQGVPACMECHGPGPSRNPAYPLLAGQYREYLVLQLELFKQEKRGGSAYAHLMRHVAARLRPEQMKDVARYYASLSPAGHSTEHFGPR